MVSGARAGSSFFFPFPKSLSNMFVFLRRGKIIKKAQGTRGKAQEGRLLPEFSLVFGKIVPLADIPNPSGVPNYRTPLYLVPCALYLTPYLLAVTQKSVVSPQTN